MFAPVCTENYVFHQNQPKLLVVCNFASQRLFRNKPNKAAFDPTPKLVSRRAKLCTVCQRDTRRSFHALRSKRLSFVLRFVHFRLARRQTHFDSRRDFLRKSRFRQHALEPQPKPVKFGGKFLAETGKVFKNAQTENAVI